ncbi:MULTISPECIES: hypothetical protein [Clostridium]|jgi:hypothetical protein|uniref:Uncharacterized protein n=2 Tax=Clostridium TaxID=1485 RepID=A0A1S8RMX2_CLOBE|nr:MULTISPECIES: hypothetical protein [Clostridium]AQS05313.1 hypothetical protein CLBIJ_27440 [Clostridium beijerinckii]MBA2885626.1 hypothetical protein [Clostridium beijerinckii]MBA2900359.1 hypothetical protein [Clostridium beijerinckii]MBA2910184.1 hypothetical protein [Clostridium beijerinckii]MBA9015114.1 hypothetical protein [Clostridium beijerinckii]
MNDKDFYNSTKSVSDPASQNYNKVVKEKAHQESPFGEAEPSSHTEFKKKRH